MKKVAVLGPAGTNGHEAASRFFDGLSVDDVLFCSSNEEVFEIVLSSEAEHGVVPIRNSSTGLIEGTKGFWTNSGVDDFDVHPLMELSLPIRHCLLVRQDAEVGKFAKVLSHPEALKQCAKSIKRLGIGESVAALSTADASKTVSLPDAGSDWAAIASRFAADVYGLKVLEEDIQDNSGNTTTFHLIGRYQAKPTTGCKTAVIFWLKNEPSALVRTLNIISGAGRNMFMLDTIFSGDNDNIAFYVEFDGHRVEPVTASIITLLEHSTNRLVVLGSFPELLYL